MNCMTKKRWAHWHVNLASRFIQCPFTAHNALARNLAPIHTVCSEIVSGSGLSQLCVVLLQLNFDWKSQRLKWRRWWHIDDIDEDDNNDLIHCATCHIISSLANTNLFLWHSYCSIMIILHCIPACIVSSFSETGLFLKLAYSWSFIHILNVTLSFVLSLFWKCAYHIISWFKVAVSSADLAGTVPHRSRRRGPDSGERVKRYIEGTKNVEKITTNLKKNVEKLTYDMSKTYY